MEEKIQEQDQEVNPPFFKRPPKWIVILSFIINVLIILGLIYYFLIVKTSTTEDSKNEQKEKVVCTQEAIQCPDGSYVSRTAPNCEFSLCPSPKPTEQADQVSNWKIYTNEKIKITFKHPQTWKIKESFLQSIDEKGRNQYSDLPQRIELSPLSYTQEASVIWLSYVENPKNLSLKDFEVENTSELSGYGPGVYSPDNRRITTLKGISAYYSKNIPCDPTGCESYIIPRQGRIFILKNNAKILVSSQKEIFDQILSTFQFID